MRPWLCFVSSGSHWHRFAAHLARRSPRARDRCVLKRIVGAGRLARVLAEKLTVDEDANDLRAEPGVQQRPPLFDQDLVALSFAHGESESPRDGDLEWTYLRITFAPSTSICAMPQNWFQWKWTRCRSASPTSNSKSRPRTKDKGGVACDGFGPRRTAGGCCAGRGSVTGYEVRRRADNDPQGNAPGRIDDRPNAPLPQLCRVLPRLGGGESAPSPASPGVQHLGLTIRRRTILGKAMSYTSPGVVRHRPLRVGACLSLTGRYRLFGTQAAHGLEVWRGLDGQARLIVEDDGSDPVRLSDCLAGMAPKCDLLLGPYSTELMRAAAR